MVKTPDAVDLYWIPLGAGGQSVRLNGRVFEFIEAALNHRRRLDLYHAALVVHLNGQVRSIEVAPSPNSDGPSRGVVATGAVGSRLLGGLRLFRYELRCTRDTPIPDLGYAIGGPLRLTDEPLLAQRLVDLVSAVPRAVWGRDEQHAGEMWNSNSVVAWLIFKAGLTADVRPPRNGRAPGWNAGVEVARRNA